jgi:F-type H+-transporting ATPase subunit delta
MSLLQKTGRILPSFVRQATRIASIEAQQRRCYADMAFTFGSSTAVFYNNANVKQIDVPSFSGSFGILPQHVPLLAVLKPGVITVTINDDSSVQILAEEACPVDQLDGQAIRDGATKAAQDLLSAGSDQAKAEAQIALECYDALQKAVDGH